MWALLVIGESVGLIVGSLMAGILLCWSLWFIFKLFRHPAWGPPVVVVPSLFALMGKLPNSEFLQMSLVFAVIAAVPFWVEGREWRMRHAVPSARELPRFDSSKRDGRDPDSIRGL